MRLEDRFATKPAEQISSSISTYNRFDTEDGYEFAGTLENLPHWVSVSGWGLDGWDAGEWPLVVFGRTRTVVPQRGWGRVVRVEGDVTIKYYETEAEMLRALDYEIKWYWKQSPERYGFTGDEDFSEDRYSGPFSWARLNAHRDKEAADA